MPTLSILTVLTSLPTTSKRAIRNQKQKTIKYHKYYRDACGTRGHHPQCAFRTITIHERPAPEITLRPKEEPDSRAVPG